MQAKNDIGSFDAILDAKYGKLGTPEREAFHQEAYAFCAGQIISDARKHEKITQKELAEKVGTNKTYISKIENGIVEPSVGLFFSRTASSSPASACSSGLSMRSD